MAWTYYKSPGKTVFPRHDAPERDCVLYDILADHPDHDRLPWPEGFTGGIAHRLDVSTSGAIWVAETPGELLEMREAFATRRLVKRYRFLARKDVPWSEHSIFRPIAHAKGRKKRMVVQRGARTPHRGRWLDAHTEFARLDGNLWSAVIRTGVMHQIRVHAAFVGLPLLGDRLYGGGPPPADAAEGTDFFLHHEGLQGPDGGTDPVPLPAWCATPGA